MEYRLLVVVIAILAVSCQNCNPNVATQQLIWDGATSVSGVPLNALMCVKDTQIDFMVPQSTVANLPVTSLTGGATTYQNLRFSNNGGASLQFLNRDGMTQSYSLGTVSLSSYSAGARMMIQNAPVAPDYELSFTFENGATNESVVLSVMLLKSTTAVPNSAQLVVRNTAISNYPDLRVLYSFVKNLQGVSGTLYGVSSLALFNQMDFGLFLTTQDMAGGCKINYLLSKLVYQLPATADPTFTGSPYINPTSSSQLTTGNLLCWGSNVNTGTFQTHMRDNYGLWVGWTTALIFWLTLLIGDSTSTNCYDPAFSDNKWTCWGMYSLFYLAHEEFFSRMLRTVPMFICFWWQACVAALLYCFVSPTIPQPTNIIIFGLIAWACSLPLQWLFGSFTRPLYRAYREKLETRKKIKSILNKESPEVLTLEDQMDSNDLTIYSSYYWLYMLSFACFVVFVSVTVNRLQQLPREQYFQQQYWLAALAVAWILDNFIFDPLLTLIFGNTSFYRFRPYYYDGKLGQTFKELDV